ncbi:MAG: 2-oxoacid:acceptor oxidoreductase subunit alpha, partial [Muribaculaceae bacterium]|nr:2-oxoacid:acceptor oxidoreductase subunit alpha [Muribaculaceae bacterium]
HFRYINPLPANTRKVFSQYKRVIVAELNTGQMADYLQAKMPEVNIKRINKIQGQPFMIQEVKDAVKSIISEAKNA